MTEIEITENPIELNQSKNLNEKIIDLQNQFLSTNLGKTINNAIDIGLKAILPDLIEDEIINIKDAILENGFREGINETIKSAIDIGKSAQGIVTGKFENTNQIELAVKSGGILDKTSKLLDYAINLANKKNLIDKTTSLLIRNGKNSIISSISNKIEENLTNQIKAVEKIEKFCDKWKDAYGNHDVNEMDKAYKNIENNLNKAIPLESIINKARSIENIHNLVKNKGNKFDLSDDEIALANRL